MSLKLTQPPRWHEMTAIFGGRFDPPHRGHREAILGLFKYPAVKKVVIVPSATPPHKPAIASTEDRVEMARLNFKNLPGLPFPEEVSFDLRELDRAQKNSNRPSYSYETLEELRTVHDQLAFVIGTDQLNQLQTWYRFPEILELCHWIIIERKLDRACPVAHESLRDWAASGLIQAGPSGLWLTRTGKKCLIVVPTDAPEISSTQIRESIATQGAPPEASLLPEVLSYLKSCKLYGI